MFSVVQPSIFGRPYTRGIHGSGPYTKGASGCTYSNLWQNAVDSSHDANTQITWLACSYLLSGSFLDSLYLVQHLQAGSGEDLLCTSYDISCSPYGIPIHLR